MVRKSSDYIQIALDHGIDIPARTIYLTSCSEEESGIDWQMADRVLRGLRLLGTGDQPVNLVINSFGGEDDHARAIIGAIRQCPVEVHGFVFGRAESAGAWILQVCDRRTMDRSSNLMLHMGSSDKTKHSSYVDGLFVEDILLRLREKDPGYSKQKLVRQLHDDWYLYPSQALALGLIDEVI